MGIDLGSVEATLKLNDAWSIVLKVAGANQQEFIRAVLEAGGKAKDSNDKLASSFNKLAASLDPAIAGEQKLEKAHHTLDQALQKNLIDQAKYNDLLDKAKEKYEHAGQSSSLFSQLIGKLGSVTGEGGELVAKLTEHVAGLGEKLEEIGKSGESVTGALAGMAGGLAAFVPLLLAAAAAAASFGAAWVAFDFLKEATAEGLKTQGVILQLENSLRANGAAAGYSSKMIIEEAESLALLSGQTKEAILQGFALETRFTKIGHDIFPRVAEAAVNLSRALPNKSVEEAFSTLSRVMEGDARGLMALKEAGLVLLPSQKAYLLQLSEQGKITEYQNLLMDILEGKLGKAAETYGDTLPGAIDRSKFALAEFKEGIASEIIPGLESLGAVIIKQIGHSDDLVTAWKNIIHEAQEFGHEVGDRLRLTVGGSILLFEGLMISIHGAHLAILDFERDVVNSKLGDALKAILDPVSFGAGLAGQKVPAKNTTAFDSQIDALRSTMADELEVVRAVRESIISHEQALGGSEDKPGGGKGGLDILKKTKEIKGIAAALNDWDKVIQAFNNHITDQNGKLDEQISEQEALQHSLAEGLEAYGLEEQQQKRNAAVFAVVSKADQEYRTEVEKLTEVIKKLHDAKDTKDEQEKIKALSQVKAEYEGTRLAIIAKAGAEVDAKSKTTETLALTRELAAAEQAYSKLEAEIADALNGTTTATEAAEKARVVYQAGVKASLITDAAGIKLAKEKAAADYDLTKQDEKLLAVAKEYGRLQAQVNLGTLQAHIDTGLSERLQTIQATFLDSLTDGGKRTVEQGIELFRQLAGGDEEVLKQMLANVQADIGALYDQTQAKKISGISKSPLDTYREQQAEYQHLLDAGMSSEADAHKAMADGQQKFWADQVSTWKTAVDDLAKIGGKIGGIFSAVGEALGALQGAQATGAAVSGAATSMGASSSTASSAGIIAQVVMIFVDIYNAFDAHIKKLASQTYGTGNSNFNITGGDIATGYLDDTGRKVVNEIKKLVKQFGDALGGTITDLDQIGVRIRNDGKYVESWVKDHFIGHFASVDEAIQAALEYELQTGAMKFKGISDLIAQGMKSFTESNYDAEVQFLDQLRKIDDLAKTQGQISLESTLHGLDDLFEALSSLKDPTAAVIQGFNSISLAEDNAWQQWRDSITGRTQSAAELLKVKQQEGEMFNAEREMRLADLALRKLDLQQQLDLLKIKAGAIVPGRDSNGPPMGGGGSGAGLGGQDPHAGSTGNSALTQSASLSKIQSQIYLADLSTKSTYVKAQADLLTPQQEIYNAQIGMIQAQIDAIAKIIAAMPDAIDIPSIRLPNTGGAGGKTPAQQFDQQLKDIIAQGLNPAAKALYDYQKQLADLADQYKHNKVSAKDYQDALAELKKEFQAGLLATARGYAGKGNDPFQQKLQDGQKFFADLEKMGSAKSGIPKWLEQVLKGEFLDSMKKDWQSRVNDFMGMTNPMDAITANAKTLTDDLNALAVATGMSADQIKAAKDQIAQGAEYQKQNAINGIMDSVFGYLKDDAAYAGEASKLKKAELDIQFRLWEYQLKSLGAWTDASAKLFHDAQAAADAAADASNSANRAAQAASRLAESEDPWALLKSYTDAALPPLTVQLNKIYSDFSVIIATFGQTAAVMNAETAAIQAAFKQAENGLDTFYNSLNNGAASSLTIDQQFHAAQQTYEATLAEVQAGNYTHLGDLNAEAQALIALGGQEYGTSTGGFTTLRMDILSELQPILALAGINANPITGAVSGPSDMSGSLSAGFSNVVASTNGVTGAITNASQRQEALLTQILISLQSSGGNGPAMNRANRVQSYGRG